MLRKKKHYLLKTLDKSFDLIIIMFFLGDEETEAESLSGCRNVALLLRVGFPAVAVKQRHHLTSDDLKADVHKVINTGIIIISVFAEPSIFWSVPAPMLLKSLWLPSFGSSQTIYYLLRLLGAAMLFATGSVLCSVLSLPTY